MACGPTQDPIAAGAQAAQTAPLPTGTLDELLAPIALYPDSLLAQMLMSATDAAKITELDKWLKANQTLKGTALQDAAVKAGFDASFVALTLFPQVVAKMADQIAWTRVLGQAFTSDKSAVFASIQKLRLQAKKVGTLKSSPQQEVETKTTAAGQEVIVIEPTNPQIVYVPQYNTEVVYTQAPTTVVVVEEDDDADEAIAAGLIGFTAGIVIGATMDNNYYYGPYGFHGGAYMYNDAWDDYYDHREDAREDWQDHREDLGEERGDRAENRSEQRTERTGTTQEQRTDRQETRQENRPESQAQRTTPSERAATQSATSQAQRSGRTGSAEARGYGEGSRTQAAKPTQRSGSSDAFSGYSNGQSQRSSSARGQAEPRQLARRRRRRPPPVSADEVNTHDQDHSSYWRCSHHRRPSRHRPRRSRAFATPEDAVKALVDTVKTENLDALVAIFGPEGRELAASSDPATGRMNRRVFAVAFREQWHLEDATPTQKTLVIGNEEWPFPVPLVKAADGWRFDTAAGKEEVLARRIGRNELQAIATSRAYVTAQRRYAQEGHDGKPAGVHATKFKSDPGKQNGLYWPAARGEKRSPLGDLVAQAADEGRHARRGFPAAYWLSWLLLQDPDRPGSCGTRRSQELYRQGRDVWWIRACRLAGSVRRHRCHDVHRQSGRHRAGTRPGPWN